jgi:hypothetical protein
MRGTGALRVTEHPDLTRRPAPAASKGSTRRHRVPGRSHQVLMRFTDAEYEALATRAASKGVTIQRFLASAAFASPRPSVSAPAALISELAALRRLTGSLSNNINQIARWLNSGGRPDARVTAALDSAQRAMRRLDAVLAWLGAPERAAPEDGSGAAEGPSELAERRRPRGELTPARRNADPRQRA